MKSTRAKPGARKPPARKKSPAKPRAARRPSAPKDGFVYANPFPHGEDTAKYRLVSREHVRRGTFAGKPVLVVDPEALTVLAATAMRDVSFLLRPKHQRQVAAILYDPEASPNDRFVATTLLRNAEVSSKFELPFCQDTGTATIVAWKGQQVWTGANDEEFLSKGIYKTYTEENLRYSQTVALDMYDEVNTGNNLPAQIDIYATDGDGVQVPLRRQRRRLGEQDVPLPGDEGAPEPDQPRSLPRREDEEPRHRGLPAVPHRDRHRRDVGRGVPEDRQARLDRLLDALPTTGNERARRSATWSWRRGSSRPPRSSGSAPSSAASTSPTTSASSACRGTAPPARSAWASPARPTGTSRRRSTAKGLWLEELERNPGRSFPSSTAPGNMRGS